MTGRAVDSAISDWFRERIDGAEAPQSLRASVLALPDAVGPRSWPWSLPGAVRLRTVLVLVAIAALLATAALVGSRMLDTRTVVPAWHERDACEVLVAAFGPNRVPNGRSGEHALTPWGAGVCVNDGWDGGWENRHLLLRREPTTREEAATIVGRPDLWVAPAEADGFSSLPVQGWRGLSPGIWLGEAGDGRAWYALAVSAEPYFFVVTGRSQGEVFGAATGVAEVLGISTAIRTPPWPDQP